MNLIVSTRVDELHIRFDVEGKWRYGDALGLAYLIKAGAARAAREDIVVDLRRLVTPPGVYGKFMFCDRLHRALPTTTNVAVIAVPELLDDENSTDVNEGPRVGCFTFEPEALHWLHRKNPSDLRTEG